VNKTPVCLGRRTRAETHGAQPQALRAVFRRQELDVCGVFRRYERRKRGDYRLGQQDRETQRTETEPDQHDRPWEDSHKTVQIECEVRRRGRRGMAMSLVGSLHLVDTIGVHEAHHRSHGEQTRH
jgi:hypothetical protein